MKFFNKIIIHNWDGKTYSYSIRPIGQLIRMFTYFIKFEIYKAKWKYALKQQTEQSKVQKLIDSNQKTKKGWQSQGMIISTAKFQSFNNETGKFE